MKARIVPADHWFDFRYGVETCRRKALHDLRVESKNRTRGNQCEPSRILPLKRFLREVQPQLPLLPVLVDVGCGKGRVLMVAALCGISRVKGVEFARELYEQAQRNCENFMSRTGIRAEYEITMADATEYPIAPQDNVFFFFNPFEDFVMQQALGNIERSWQQSQRRVLLCLYNQPSTEQFDRLRSFRRHSTYDFWGYQFVVYESVPPEQNESPSRSATAEKY